MFCELFGSGVAKEFVNATCFILSSIFHTMALRDVIFKWHDQWF
jgi:hypothetical protein